MLQWVMFTNIYGVYYSLEKGNPLESNIRYYIPCIIVVCSILNVAFEDK